jgi:hypothetical protein
VIVVFPVFFRVVFHIYYCNRFYPFLNEPFILS